jgi:ribosome-associated heat shock protein Hsp15
MSDASRTDKWLWSVRIFKTRSMATEACHKGHVQIDGIPAKPSRSVKPGDIIKVRRAPIYRSYRVNAIPLSRIGAKEAGTFVTEVTPPEELKLLENQKDMLWYSREKGSGRPTKKERRDLDSFFQL